MKTWILFLLLFFSINSFAQTSEILVLFKDLNLKESQILTLDSMGFRSEVVSRGNQGFPRMQLLRLHSPRDIRAALATLRANSLVKYAEPNYEVHLVKSFVRLPFNETSDLQWNFVNKGQIDSDGHEGVVGADIHMAPVWEKNWRGSRNVLVATIDTGIDWTHPALQENIFTNEKESGVNSNNGIDDDGNGYIDDVHGFNTLNSSNKSNDDNGHGSHVAGIIGAMALKDSSVVGINQKVSLLPVKCLDASGTGTLQSVVDGLSYAIMMKAQIINNSWAMTEKSQILEDLVKETEKQGIVMVAAAGNSWVNLEGFKLYPASFQQTNTISVAASNNRDLLWNLSDTGPYTVDVAAPGENILSTDKKGQYKIRSGTSIAAPHVTGIAALLKAEHPDWQASQIKEHIVGSCDPLIEFRHKVKCQGRVNAWNALNGITPPNPFVKEEAFKAEPFVIESGHPYENRLNQYFDVQKPGAKYIRVRLEKVELEWDRDHLYIETPDGQVVEQIDGSLEDYPTDYVEGDHLRIRLKTDGSRTYYGFKVKAVEFVN